MKLYTAERHYDYEGFVILGIFSARNVAEAACEDDRWPDGDRRGDSHEVNEFTLDVRGE